MSKVPVIDIEPLMSRRCARHSVAQELNHACREFGFFYIKNHGVPQSGIDELMDLSRAFFARSEREKLEIAMAKAGAAWRGYFPVGDELTSGVADLKEGIYFGQDHDREHQNVKRQLALFGQNLYPDNLWHQVVSRYMQQLEHLGHTLMAGLSLSLGLAEDYFYRNYTKDPFLLFRIFHYPAIAAAKENQWGVGEHTDYGLLTILYQDNTGGLQVKTPKGWIEAPYIPGTFICNLGDMLDYLTGGLYCSTPHRVSNTSERSRISMPFFFDPNFDAKMKMVNLQRNQLAEAHERWDKQNLHEFKGSYGDYLLGKVSQVFPELKGYVQKCASQKTKHQKSEG